MGIVSAKEFLGMCEKVLLVSLVFFCFLAVFVYDIKNTDYQQFVYLADAFVHGQLHFREMPGSDIDIAWYHGKAYWFPGPFAAILLVPFVAFFGTGFLQGYVNFPLVVLNFYLLYSIALKLGIKKRIDACWLAFAYVFATMYFSVAVTSSSWRFAQIVATTLLLLALVEYLTKKRFWLIGLCIAFAFATRAHLVLSLSFFMLGIYNDAGIGWRDKLKEIGRLVSPVIAVGIALLLYNYARFENIFETGLILDVSNIINYKNTFPIALAYGGGKLFSLAYVPTNIYYYFFNGLQPALMNPRSYILHSPFVKFSPAWGFNNIFLFAPIFFFTLLARAKEKIVRQSWVAALLIFGVLLLYFVPHNRYLLDLMPFLFILLVRGLSPAVRMPVKLLIVLSMIINFGLMHLGSIS